MAATEVIPRFERLKAATRALITPKTCTEQGTRRRHEAKLKASCRNGVGFSLSHLHFYLFFFLIPYHALPDTFIFEIELSFLSFVMSRQY